MLALLLPPYASAQAEPAQESSWPLIACGDPDNLPYSNREEEGFENEIASLLAAEMGAQLEYVWQPLPRREGSLDLMLRMGICDLLLGVPDGSPPHLTTLAYYRSTAVFVTREDAPFEIESLDDPDLARLEIGVQRGSPEDFALVERGMIENVHHFFVSDPGPAILEEVASGELDVGIVWGPVAGYYRRSLDLPLVLEPVTPAISASFLPMVQSTSMAVRANDHFLADLLNRAITSRWDDIQSILGDHGVELLPLPPPSLGEGRPGDLNIGVVLPAATGIDPVFPMGDELIGEPARRGAVLAEEFLQGHSGLDVRLLQATAPTPEAATRAARRLIAAGEVPAIVGGVGEGQADALVEVTGEAQVLFLNVGESDQTLREQCRPLTFHVEASDQMYLNSLLALMRERELSRPFVVHSDDERGEELLQLLSEGIDSAPTLAGSAPVPPGQPLYWDAFAAAQESGADAVILLLDAGSQLVFLGQYGDYPDALPVLPFPEPITQTRPFYAALAQDGSDAARLHTALWDASLQGEGQRELNERYLSRWGRPMEPSAWAAFAGVSLVAEAFESSGSTAPAELAQALLVGESDNLAIAKSEATGFSEGTRQLGQTLYLLNVRSPQSESEEVTEVVGEFEAFETESDSECGGSGGG